MKSVTIYILKFCELFVHFEFYLLKFRRQYELLCCLLAKIRAFLQNWSLLFLHLRKHSVWKMVGPDESLVSSNSDCCLLLISLVRLVRSGDGSGSS